MLMAYGSGVEMSFVGQWKWIGGGDQHYWVDWIGGLVHVEEINACGGDLSVREKDRERER